MAALSAMLTLNVVPSPLVKVMFLVPSENDAVVNREPEAPASAILEFQLPLSILYPISSTSESIMSPLKSLKMVGVMACVLLFGKDELLPLLN